MKKNQYNKKYFDERDTLDLLIAESVIIFMRDNNLKKVLDVGCGTGKLVKFLNDNDFQAYGSDNANLAVKTAQKINKKNIIVKTPATKLPFKKNSFDMLTAISVIEHLTKKEVNTFMFEAKRVLKPNGFIFIITPNHASPLRLILKEKWFGFSDPTHITFFTPRSLFDLLKRCGFKNVRLRHKTAYNIPSSSDYHIPGFLRKLPMPIKNILNYLMVSSFLSTYRDSFWIAAQKS